MTKKTKLLKNARIYLLLGLVIPFAIIIFNFIITDSRIFLIVVLLSLLFLIYHYAISKKEYLKELYGKLKNKKFEKINTTKINEQKAGKTCNSCNHEFNENKKVFHCPKCKMSLCFDCFCKNHKDHIHDDWVYCYFINGKLRRCDDIDDNKEK